MSAAHSAWLDPGPWLEVSAASDANKVNAAILCERPGVAELAILLSPAAKDYLEPMAQRALSLTRRHFGKTISLYVPLYVSNHCASGCLYCGFASDRDVPRRRLQKDELLAEMLALKQKGLEEVLLLTGERSDKADFEYLLDCVSAAGAHFSSVTVESFSMTVEEYAQLGQAGCTGITLYQETYDPAAYRKMHRWGFKRDYAWRLDAPARALSAGLRTAGVGVLLGLADPVADLLCLFRHIQYLRKTFWQAGILVSFPRICPQNGGYPPPHPVQDDLLAQIIFAFRICLPDVPLVLSTREKPHFRDGIAGIGISRMSVASKTTVGGYSHPADAGARDGQGQFDVMDNRGVEEFSEALRNKGLCPVLKNWDAAFQPPRFS
jgi:2-iminoacetate synthase